MSIGYPTQAPGLELAFELKVSIGPTVVLGAGSGGVRRTVGIMGGTFEGVISGRVLSGGADWQIAESDELTHVDAHYAIETDDGVRIEVVNQGVRHGSADVLGRIAAGEPVDPKEYYFRTTPRFYPPNGKYEWLRSCVFVGVAERYKDQVVVQVWKVL